MSEPSMTGSHDTKALVLPDLIFSDIMMKVGFESLEGLHRCRQVCSKWNEKILIDIRYRENLRKIIKERVEKNWSLGMLPTDEEILNAKLAGKGCFLLKFIAFAHLKVITFN